MKTSSLVTGILLVTAAALLPVVGWRLSVKAYHDDHSETPVEKLVDAAGAGKIDEMKRLLNSGINLSAGSEAGMAPLFAAISAQQNGAVRLLLSRGADVNQRYKETTEEKRRITRRRYMGMWNVSDGDTPLLACARVANLDSARLMVSNGADVQAVNDVHSTSVSLAMQAQSLEMIRFLVQKGASVAVTDSSGDTPLMWVLRHNSPPLELAIIRSGVNIDSSSVNLETALILATAANNSPDVALILASKAKDVSLVDGKGFSPLWYAVMFNRTALAKVLLDRGALPNQKARDGSTPLINAVFRGKTDLVRLLVAAHADPNIKDKNGMTALAWAVAKQNKEIESIIQTSYQTSLQTSNRAGK